MVAILDPRFELIGTRTLRADALTPKGGVVDIARAGTRGVIGALLAAEAGEDAWLLRDPSSPLSTESGSGMLWLQTSGTTGAPKWAGYRVSSLAARIVAGKGERARWLLTYNPGAFAGVQVILSAMIGGHALVAPAPGAPVSEMARIAVSTQVTHVSGTPTFWRAFLMALGDADLPLRSITLGGEAVDQPLLDSLKVRFPEAKLRHIYATTEVGAVFSVSDGRAGFPRDWLYQPLNGLKLTLSADDTLRVENPKASGTAAGQIWDTGDVVELSGDRVLFKGRKDAMVNVGGVKVFPETVEAHLMALPFIQDVRVTPKPNPITGHVLMADIVLKPFSGEVESEIKGHLATLPRAARPASLRFVDALDIGATGKKLRT